MAQGLKVPGRVEGGTPKGEGWSTSSTHLVSQFAKCCPSLYLLEKACAHAVSLGKVNKFAQKLLKLPWGLCSSLPWVSMHTLVMTNFCDSYHVRAGILAIARKAGGEPGWGGVPAPPSASAI